MPNIKHATFNKSESLTKILISAKRKIEALGLTQDDLEGGKFRSRLVKSLVSEIKHPEFLLVDKDTALVVQVSSPGGAYSKFLEILLAFNNGEIKQCIFVTQTYNLAVRRNQIKNPDSTRDGHRIYFSKAKSTIAKYTDSFLSIPIGILGVDISETR